MKRTVSIIILILSQLATADIYPGNPSYGTVCVEFLPYVNNSGAYPEGPKCIRYEEISIGGEYCSKREARSSYGPLECVEYKNTDPNIGNQVGG